MDAMPLIPTVLQRRQKLRRPGGGVGRSQVGKERAVRWKLTEKPLQGFPDDEMRPFTGLAASIGQDLGAPIHVRGGEHDGVRLGRSDFPKQLVVASTFEVAFGGDDPSELLEGHCPLLFSAWPRATNVASRSPAQPRWRDCGGEWLDRFHQIYSVLNEGFGGGVTT